ncbi:recombinase family protein [Micrococcus sp. HG099]|nr:recombinase family protein [Micrococcus endophyticus]MCR8674345.1 recombinase family protein [Micrococcus sp. HG099]
MVLLSPNIDTADPAGRFTAHVLASAAQYERELISQSIREGMAQRKAEGVRFGRPNEIPDEVRERILRMRAEGVRVSHIARTLTEEGMPTARGGGVWRSSTIDRVLAQAEQMVTAA